MFGWLLNAEQLVERELTMEIEILEENTPLCYFFLHKSTWPDLQLNPALRSGKPLINRLMCGTAKVLLKSVIIQFYFKFYS